MLHRPAGTRGTDGNVIMDKRSRILGWLFGGVVGLMVLANYVYPTWVQPLLHIDKEIARLERDLEERTKAHTVARDAKYEYRDFVARVGSMDPEIVQNRMKRQLDELVTKHGLANAAVIPPRRLNVDKKTQLATMTFAMQAEGSLQSIVGLMKDVSELPYLLVVNNPRLSPVSSSSRNRQENDQIALNMSVEVMVLPQQKIIGDRFEDDKLRQPAQHVRYARSESDYAVIWQRNPFSEYSPPKPPVVVARREEPTPPPRPVVREEPPPPPPPVDKRWRDRDQYTLTMAMLMRDGQSRFDEVMLYNSRSKENRYVAVDQELDGGDLLFVHQRGALVGREDGRFVYPIGEALTSPIPVDEAVEFPELQLASSRIAEEQAAEPEPTDGEVRGPEGGLGGEEVLAESEIVPGAAVAADAPVGPMPPGSTAEHGALQDNAEDQPVDIVGLPPTHGAVPEHAGSELEPVTAADVKPDPGSAGTLPTRRGSGSKARVTLPPKMSGLAQPGGAKGRPTSAKVPIRRVPASGGRAALGTASADEQHKAAADPGPEVAADEAENGKTSEKPGEEPAPAKAPD